MCPCISAYQVLHVTSGGITREVLRVRFANAIRSANANVRCSVRERHPFGLRTNASVCVRSLRTQHLRANVNSVCERDLQTRTSASFAVCKRSVRERQPFGLRTQRSRTSAFRLASYPGHDVCVNTPGTRA